MFTEIKLRSLQIIIRDYMYIVSLIEMYFEYNEDKIDAWMRFKNKNGMTPIEMICTNRTQELEQFIQKVIADG